MYTVYIIESIDQRWYYGSSENVIQRVADHNSNRANFTRHKGPWKLIFRKDFQDKTEALQFEIKLKKLKNKEYIKTAYAEYFL